MTTIITRLYETQSEAESVTAALAADGFPADCYEIITQTGASSAMDAIEGASVPRASAELYAQALTATRALVVVRAPEVPFGAARNAAIIADEQTSLDAGVSNENMFVAPEPRRELRISVLDSHPRFMTSIYQIIGYNRAGRREKGTLGFPTLLHRRRPASDSIVAGGMLAFRTIFPAKTLITTQRESKVFAGGRKFFTAS